MSLEFCVLGSGSSGNSTVVRAPWGAFLLDAGFGPRTTDQRMHGIGLSVKDISAIVLTHLDHDHFNPNWLLTLVKQRIRLHMARRRMKDFLHFRRCGIGGISGEAADCRAMHCRGTAGAF